MSSFDKIVPLGRLLKPHGIKGELKVLFYNENSNSLENNQIIFLSDLDNEIIAGAAIDVFNKEPLDNESALIRAKNILLTPHLGASTKENLMRIGEIICSIISEFNQ